MVYNLTQWIRLYLKNQEQEPRHWYLGRPDQGAAAVEANAAQNETREEVVERAPVKPSPKQRVCCSCTF